MRAWFLGGMLAASFLMLAVPSSSAEDLCDGMLSCHIQNQPPDCSPGWYGYEEVDVGPIRITYYYCKYWGPEP